VHLHPRSIRGRLALPSAVLALLACGGGSGTNLGGGGGGPGGGTGGGPGGGTTINGVVLDAYRQPLAGRTVLVGGQSKTTDSTGAFSASVTTPYDVVILEPAPAKVATVFSQLTRTDPKLYDFGASGSATRSATLGGHLVGGDPLPTPSGELTGVSWGSAETSTGSYVTGSPYTFPVAWSGPSTSSGSVHALQWTVDDNGTVSGYVAHGVTTGVSLTSAGTTGNADVMLSAVLSDHVTATVHPPAGHALVARAMFVTFSDQAYFPVSSDGLDTADIDLPVPSGIGASAIVNATATDGSSQTMAQVSGIQPGTTGVSITLPAPALSTAPADGATGVDTSTDLVWTPVAGGVHVLLLGAGAADPTYVLVSGGTHVRIPDLSAQGLALPSGRLYDFGLVAVGPYATLDDFAATGTIPREGFGFLTVSATQFTTR